VPRTSLPPQNVQFREQECEFGGQNLANSLYFSLLAGNFGGEELAPDCALRHAVSNAEKPGCVPRKIAGNHRNSADFALNADWRKCPTLPRRQALSPFSLKGPRAVRFQRIRLANAMRSQADDLAKATDTLPVANSRESLQGFRMVSACLR
jgi:hypothetical protein